MLINTLFVVFVFSPIVFVLLLLFLQKCLSHNKLIILANINILSVAIFFNYLIFNKLNTNIILWEIIDIYDIKANFSIKADALSIYMLNIVSNISFIVHMYSIKYMQNDEGKLRFTIYLSTFTFAMFILVVADNMIQIFIGWEGVGLISYLLIGFWYDKSDALEAAKKAFIVNRISDFALLFGIIVIVHTFQGIDFDSILNNNKILEAKELIIFKFYNKSLNKLDLCCIFLLIGCMGKSAQILFHIWLPDAMKGPTPASALIHAATMVTAGIFLIVRCNLLFSNSDIILNIVLYIGILTALFGAISAVSQDDIKKIIAYSTCSQLGYMFAACGTKAFTAAMFHLLTHAFFKALLFLGAGSIIHSINGEQNIKKMGKLANYIPYTFSMMLVGSMNLSGVYPLSGFFSKDLILQNLYISNHKCVFYIALLVSILTTIYCTRLIFYVFIKDNNFNFCINEINPHDPPFLMKLAMIILSIGSIFFGILEKSLGENSINFWENIIIKDNLKLKEIIPIHIQFIINSIGTVFFIISMIFFYKKTSISNTISNKNNITFFEKLTKNAFYFDLIYEKIFLRSFYTIVKYMNDFIEKRFFNNITNYLVLYCFSMAKNQQKIYNGQISHYAMIIFLFTIGMIYYIGMRHIFYII
ncbi:NADH-quinone oxidoreductase subunit L [Lyticum sinuosum]|uniref:NADH-quinone oxidoreductase subunit L n=1 Tax=Lyticum sinuosum TaxID=1332059 RepID=A0AAE4VKV7_9RICK|nr:NADH-quinone oxidoreductase subunit L [Lyticum sinuosum]MDZ5761318.1 NADH-quinone oxidoreductase subunit L [Lyticum sinuosum]